MFSSGFVNDITKRYSPLSDPTRSLTQSARRHFVTLTEIWRASYYLQSWAYQSLLTLNSAFVCFVSVTFKASIGISDVENYLPVIIGHQNDLTNYNAPRLTLRISFPVPFRSLTLRSTFKWTHNGTVLPVRNFGRVFVRPTTGVLNIFPSILEDEGVYQSFISNELGTMFGRKFRMKFRGDLIIHFVAS